MYILDGLIWLLKPIVVRFPRVAEFYRAVRDQLRSIEEPAPTPWGFRLAGNAAMQDGTFEPIETEIVRKTLEKVDVMVNVGANVGYYCCHALSLNIPVIAFEPMPRNFRYLYKNVKANNWDDIEIFPIALSNRTGVLEIYGDDTGASLLKGWAGIPEDFKTLVPCSTMDAVLGGRLDGKRALILVDIEGAEKWMLEGANTLLNNNPKPIWLVEIMTNDHQPGGIKINPDLVDTFELFFKNGYRALSANQAMRPIDIHEVRQVSIGKTEFGTHNFIFIE